MDAGPFPENPDPRRPRIPTRAYGVCYGVLGLALAGILAARYAYPLIVREPIGVAPGAADLTTSVSPEQSSEHTARIEWRIDPNTADWMELTRLPRIGETLAKRIVAYREAQRKAKQDGINREPVFRSPGDLEAVPGIGPKTVQRIAGWLKFPDPPATSPAPTSN